MYKPHVGKQEEASQLVELLRVTGDLEEQGDILHYMTEQYGLSFKVCGWSAEPPARSCLQIYDS